MHYATLDNGRISQPGVIRVLLDNGAKVSVTDVLGHSPLHYAVLGRKRSVEVAKKLLEHDAVPNARSLTTIKVARDKTVFFGLARRSTIHLYQERYFLPAATPLHYAAASRDSDIMRYLIQSGGDVSIRDLDGNSVADRWRDAPRFKNKENMPDFGITFLE